MHTRTLFVALVICLGSALPPSRPGLDPRTKDVIDVVSKGLGAVGIVVGAIGVMLGVRTRRQDLRWRKATAAHDALAEIRDHPDAARAIDMMDAKLAHQALKKDSMQERGAFDEACAVLREGGEDWEAFWKARRSFDWLLYFVDRAGYMIKRDFAQLKDVAEPLSPYAQLLCDNWKSFEVLVAVQRYKYAESLLREVASMPSDAA